MTTGPSPDRSRRLPVLTFAERRDQILDVQRGGPRFDAWRRARDARVLRRRDVVARYLEDRLSGFATTAGRTPSYANVRLKQLVLYGHLARQPLGELMRDLEVEDYEHLDRRPPVAPVWPLRPSEAGLPRERVGKVLEMLRVFTGASLDVVGREIGRTFSHVRNVERGRHEPKIVDIVLMADAYNVAASTVLDLAV